MEKFKKICLIFILLFVFLFISVGCAPKEKVEEFTVSFIDGESVLKTVAVKKGENVERWTPTKEGFDFVEWYGEPTLTHEFDFTNPITADTSIFAGFKKEMVADTRIFAVVGSGTSPLLLTSNWGKVINEEHKMIKDNEKNEYTITLDLIEGDQFQFAINTSWENQRGFGYLEKTTLADGTVAFSGTGTIGENSAKRNNIKVELSGNYTFTLTTNPADDTYESNHPSYTEASKENFNINPYDKITWVRNGDASEVATAITNYYIKGSSITGWADLYTPATKMTEIEGVHTLKVYLKENEEFLFTSLVTVGDVVSTGTEYLRASNLDETSKAFVGQTASYNMVAKANGTYTFTYTESTKLLAVSFVAGEKVATDYYIDGTFADGVADWSGYCFNETYKLVVTETDSGIYEIKNVFLKADSQIIIQAFKAGSTERGEWGTDSYNGLGSYNYNYLVDGGNNFSAVGGGNNNIKVLVAGTYDITFNEYTKVMTIKKSEPVVYDIFIKGGMNNWDHAFKEEFQLSMNGDIYEVTLTFEVDWEFGLVGYQSNNHQGYGDWIGRDKLGTSGDANSIFLVDGAHNLKCSVAGTYKIVYNKTAATIDIYSVTK